MYYKIVYTFNSSLSSLKNPPKTIFIHTNITLCSIDSMPESDITEILLLSNCNGYEKDYHRV